MSSSVSKEGSNRTPNKTVSRPLTGNRIQLPANIPIAAQCSYASCYCEENVYKICEYVRENAKSELDKCSAVFVSNKKRAVPLWRQKAGRDEEKLVLWDYHVIFLYKPDEKNFSLRSWFWATVPHILSQVRHRNISNRRHFELRISPNISCYTSSNLPDTLCLR